MSNNKKRMTMMLTERYQSVAQAKNVLSRLYRQISADLNVGPLSFDRLMKKFLDNPVNNIPASGKDRSTARGNLSKQLCSDPMSFKTFLKGLRFLGANMVDFEVRITRKGVTTIHSLKLDLSSDMEEEDVEE